jgi:hypothetical protein
MPLNNQELAGHNSPVQDDKPIGYPYGNLQDTQPWGSPVTHKTRQLPGSVDQYKTTAGKSFFPGGRPLVPPLIQLKNSYLEQLPGKEHAFAPYLTSDLGHLSIARPPDPC